MEPMGKAGVYGISEQENRRLINTKADIFTSNAQVQIINVLHYKKQTTDFMYRARDGGWLKCCKAQSG